MFRLHMHQKLSAITRVGAASCDQLQLLSESVAILTVPRSLDKGFHKIFLFYISASDLRSLLFCGAQM